MQSDVPQLSVIMGVRCGSADEPSLRRAVYSILAQTFTDFEFLICESGSAPEIVKELMALAAQDDRIRLLNGANANTLTQKLNRCILAARGQWIARMDADDFSYPERFTAQMSFLQEHPDCIGVGCCVREVGATAETIRMLPPWPQVKDFRITLPFVHPTLILRRDAVSTVGGYSENPHQIGCDDYDLLLRLYARGYYIANLQEVLFDYSILSSQLQHRPYRLFINEFFTRLARFRDLGLLPSWLPWTVKPLLTGLFPRRFLYQIKHRKASSEHAGRERF